MSIPFVSIIMPCYNVDAFLNKALEHVITQTYTNWECIMVDDGSKDNTANIAKQWTKKDARFVYLFQENKGLSGARNSGLKIAKGEFVYFYDPDDLINTKTLSNLSALITDTIDIVYGKCAITEGQNHDVKDYLAHTPKPFTVFKNDNKSLLKLVVEQPLICVAWNRLIRKSFLDKYKLQFKDRLLHEDELWFFETLFNAKGIILNNEPTYYYNVANVNSITNNFGARNLECYLIIIKEVFSKYYNNPDYKQHKEIIAFYITELKIKTISHCFKKLPKALQNNLSHTITTVFKETEVVRTKKIANIDLETLHYYFNVVSSLSPKKIMLFLKYFNKTEVMRKIKKTWLLKEAKRKNKALGRIIKQLN